MPALNRAIKRLIKARRLTNNPPMRCLFLLAVTLNIFFAAYCLLFNLSLISTGLKVVSDFTVFYAGGRIMREGPREKLYDLPTQAGVERQVIAESGEPFPPWKNEMMPFNYPAHSALPFVPLNYLSFKDASRVFVAVNMLLEVYAFVLLFRLTRRWTPRERVAFLSTAFAFRAWTLTLYFGAFSAFILVCALKFYAAAKRGEDRAAGLWLAAATFKPQHAFIPMIAVAMARKWRLLAAFAFAVGAMCIAMMALCGWRVWFDYLALLGLLNRSEGVYNIFPEMMANVRGLLYMALGPGHQDALNGVALAALLFAAALMFLLWRRGWHPHDADFDLKLAATLLLGMFASPHLNPQDDLLLIGAAALLYGHTRRARLDAQTFIALLIASPSLYLIIVALDLVPLIWTWHLLPTFVLQGWLLYCYAKRGGAADVNRAPSPDAGIASA